MSKVSYKFCFVPGCRNTSVTAPSKRYFHVPRGERRRTWYAAVQKEMTSLISTKYCCEDHFNMKEDVENWTKYEVARTCGLQPVPLRLKRGRVPRLAFTSRSSSSTETCPSSDSGDEEILPVKFDESFDDDQMLLSIDSPEEGMTEIGSIYDNLPDNFIIEVSPEIIVSQNFLETKNAAGHEISSSSVENSCDAEPGPELPCSQDASSSCRAPRGPSAATKRVRYQPNQRFGMHQRIGHKQEGRKTREKIRTNRKISKERERRKKSKLKLLQT